jgi:hypothetical protein
MVVKAKVVTANCGRELTVHGQHWGDDGESRLLPTNPTN